MDINQLMSKVKQLLQHTVFQVLLFVILALVSYGVMFSNVKPEKVDVQLLQVANETLRAPKTVEDVEKTKQEKQDAVKQVDDVYTTKKEYGENRVDLISSIFDAAAEVKKESEKKNVSSVLTKEEKEELSNNNLTLLKKKLADDVNKDLTDDVYKALLNASDRELQNAKDTTITAINTVMREKIAATEVENAKKSVEDEIKYISMPTDLKKASLSLARYAITQNYFFDLKKTEEQRQAALESVEPVKILQGQILVEKGQLVDREVYRNLKLTGLLNNEHSVLPFLGLGILVVLVFGCMFYFYHKMEIKNEQRHNQILIFSLVFIIAIAILKTVSLFSNESVDLRFFIPAAMGTMILKILLDNRYSLVFTIILSIFGAIIFNENTTTNFNFSICIYILLSGIASLLLLSTKNFRSKLFQAGFLLSLVNVLIIFAVVLIMDLQVANLEYVFHILAAFVSGISSSILAIGLLPLFEGSFGILSTMKLIELSNPNHPLLRKILIEAPGTYHHSVMVANLAEAASEAIGANGLLARVGCYYHDIGKTKRPQLFIENQMNIENPHDKLQPAASRDIIIAHVVDGSKILKKYKMPQEIIDIAEQHHGTTLLKFFYYKEKELNDDVKEEDYRYPGPKPQTKESAVVSVADSVEAAVRSMKSPTREKIEMLVKSIIHDRLNDDQFSECDITIKELDIVEKTLCETLNGIFHSRIEYPDVKNEKKQVK
ncbi:HD family phosphohydrolase [Bacillus massiliigorillae]|uniref:HD family phosphohydrolase n=1 Tax=Bacillus massiliigorillae TaxID=1243664 RepID=UPI00039A2BED|nr:HD family phosphohydrolase [Bacillus massiliigorillae]